jgi:hypothetical protein
MTQSACKKVTLGDSDLGGTTITRETSSSIAGLGRKKRKRISPDGVEEETGIRKKPREGSDLLALQITLEGLGDIQHSCIDEDRYVIGTDSAALSMSGLAQTLKIQKNYLVLVEASQQLEKMLSGSGDAGIIASKILFRQCNVEMVLLSCSTVFDRKDFSTLSDRQRSGDWSEEEKEAFCRKFTYFISGTWGQRDILDKWESFCKVGQPQSSDCCVELWGEASHTAMPLLPTKY